MQACRKDTVIHQVSGCALIALIRAAHPRLEFGSANGDDGIPWENARPHEISDSHEQQREDQCRPGGHRG